jgi:hypothetical protein
VNKPIEPPNLPPPPPFSGERKQKKKKRDPASRIEDALKQMEGEILPPIRLDEPETKVQYSKEIGPPLAFPLGTGDKVRRLARYGLKPPYIAMQIDNPLTGKAITPEIIEQYFMLEYIEGARQGAEETARSVHEQATGEGGAKRNIAAAMYRAQQQVDMIGFSDVKEHHHTVEDPQLRQKIEHLSEEDIKSLRAILAKRVESGDATARSARLRRRSGGPPPDGKGSK